MRFKIFISFFILSIFATSSESYALDDEAQDSDQNQDEHVEKRTFKEIASILKDLASIASVFSDQDLDFEKLKRISVVNDIEGKNVVSDIKGTETNLRPKKGYYEHRNEELRKSAQQQIIRSQAADSIRMIQSLMDSLANCQKTSEKIQNQEIKTQKEIKKAEQKIEHELNKAKSICGKISISPPKIIQPERELVMDLNNAIDRALHTCHKSMKIKTNAGTMELNDELEDEIDEALEISRKIAKKIEEQVNDEEKVEDEKENENQSDEEIVNALRDAIDEAKNADENTLRRFAMKNKIRGENVVSKQHFHEMNLRKQQRVSPVESWNVPRPYYENPWNQPSTLARIDLTSADQHDVHSQPRYFWDEAEKEEMKNDDEEKKEEKRRTLISKLKSKKMINNKLKEDRKRKKKAATEDENLLIVKPIDKKRRKNDKEASNNDEEKLRRSLGSKRPPWEPPPFFPDYNDEERLEDEEKSENQIDVDPLFSKKVSLLPGYYSKDEEKLRRSSDDKRPPYVPIIFFPPNDEANESNDEEQKSNDHIEIDKNDEDDETEAAENDESNDDEKEMKNIGRRFPVFGHRPTKRPREKKLD